uniref:Putative conserved secreted protein n=1 Tax=Ixodes ricinus TaxID=34613 RepID=A0A6B0UI89_IXORI
MVMHKISLILLLTSSLVFNATWGTPQENICWKCLEETLNTICKSQGGTGVHTVDFANCRVYCWVPFADGLASQERTLPYGTRCGFPYKTCKYGDCQGLY